MRKKRRRIKPARLGLVVVLLLVIAGLCGIIVFGITQRLGQTAAAPSPEPTMTPTPTEDPEKHMTLFITGDALIHESVYTDAMNDDGTFDFGKQLDAVNALVKNYDLAYYNQETVLGGTELGLAGYPSFNSPQEFGDYMISCGFNLVSTANNHICDKGEAGIAASRAYWDSQAGVIMQGSNVSEEQYDEIATGEVNGITYAFLSYCEMTNSAAPYSYSVNYYPGHEEEMLEKVKQAAATADVVIVAMHWGTEYSHGANDSQRELAGKLVEAGADIIIGNHPHDIEPFELIDGKPVFYAMGNMISSQVDIDNRIGYMAAMTITKKEDGTIVIEDIKAELTYTYTEGIYPALRTNIKVYPFSALTDEILPDYQSYQSEYQAMVEALGYELDWTLK